MNKLVPFLCRPVPDWLEQITDMALDLRWTWNRGTDHIWEALDPSAWEATKNPWWILQNISEERVEQLSQDQTFKEELHRLLKIRQDYIASSAWFKQKYPEGTLGSVAYFSMEFGLGEALPLYAGGLGMLAGDFLKTASDLNVPIVGIGLLYQIGYFRQVLGADGSQVEAYPHNDPTTIPIRPVMNNNGGWLRVFLELPGRILWLRVWQVQVGRVLLYLLDSNDLMNAPADRSVIHELYDDRPEFRLLQEMALGIGGWRVIKALGLPVEICHLNEGHAAFLVLERARDFMQRTGQPFPAALCATRAGNIFTTHTPVSAGFDTFHTALVSLYFRDFAASVGISMEQLLALGRQNPNDYNEPLNMAILAMRGSIETNAVSELHAKVSRRIFQSIYPNWPEAEVPVNYVTNGAHMPSWDSKWSDKLWTDAGGRGCWNGTLDGLSEAIRNCSDTELWALRNRNRHALVDYVRQRMENQFRKYGADSSIVEQTKYILDPNLLTIGFARRFTAYKRPNLLLHAPERLMRMLNDPLRPIQIIVAGKAHPRDEEGKRLIQNFVTFARQAAVRNRVVFLSDYDIAIAQELVEGVDLWLNTPRRPWEACGTSGMKVLVNGGINFSELDGWWAEAYTPDLGWALGDGQEHDDPEWDVVEAEQLYDILEQQIIPEFYHRDDQGIPIRWVARIRESMSRLTPRFSSNRMVREYVENLYLPAAIRYRNRIARKGESAAELSSWRLTLEHRWANVHFGAIRVFEGDCKINFEAQLYLGDLNPEFVRIEIYADPWDKYDGIHQVMDRGGRLTGAVNGYLYTGSVPATRPTQHFSLRVIPSHPAACVPLEDNHILWHSPT